MPNVTYIEANGNTTTANVNSGNSVMQGAVDNSIEGIPAEYGGSCACATCHCFVDEKWLEVVGPANDMEQEMLAMVDAARVNSRLSCQIAVTDNMDGLVVRLPEEQL